MARAFSIQTRRQHLERLAGEALDLIVIGGGITGAGIALEAAMRGLTAVLLEKADFASGASSKSSKLLHGGLRYLEHGEIKLVFESLAQRNRLFHDAPHLAHPLPFLFPLYAGGRDKAWKLGAGLTLYDVMSSLSDREETHWHQRLDAEAAARAEPMLRREGLRGAQRYTDGATEDARLVIETLKTAIEAGAVALNYIEVTGLLKEAGSVVGVEACDRLSGAPLTIRARRVFNAAGPWVDAVSRLDQPDAPRRLRPTKGVHLVTAAFVHRHAVVMRSQDAHEHPPRVLFVIPYGGRTLIGTTDTDHQGAPDDDSYLDADVEASPAEVRYLLEAVNAAFAVQLSEADVISAFAGWRPLIAPPEAGRTESDISREYDIFTAPSGLMAIAGGKLTAFRSMARHAVEHVEASLGAVLAPSRIEHTRLSGSLFEAADLEAYVAQVLGQEAQLPPALVATLARRYGSNWPTLRAMLIEEDALAVPLAGLDPDLAYFAVEPVYAVRFEGAAEVSDFMMRRTRLHLLDHQQGLGALEAVARLMGQALQRLAGWRDDRRAAWALASCQAYREAIARGRSAITL